MDPDEIRAGVRALEPWFQQIDLGHGIKTKRRSTATEPIDHPADTWNIIKDCLRENLDGRSVLDVGCNAGFYTIEARRRNAGRVLGIDSQRLHVRQAQFAARVLGLEIEYQRMSVYDLSTHHTGKFGITLAIGLIYHCKHPLLALERLFQVTGDMMILESQVVPPQALVESFSDSSGIGRLHALAFVENDPGSREAAYNWFVPTEDCLKAMLSDTGFADIEVISEVNDRVVIVCSRSRFDSNSLTMPQLLGAQLTLREGPPACRPGDSVRFKLDVVNTGQSTWLDHQSAAAHKGVVRLGVHLLNELGEEIVDDYGGVHIKQLVRPGGEVVIDLALTAPSKPGAYQLEFDMVSEHVTWFEDAGSTIPVVHHLRVQ
jgi:tRNA (mo5U34)-methyltransferase